MNSKKRRVLKYLLKTVLILVSGIVISVIMLTGFDTYSWFASTISGSARVRAASAENIIDINNIEFVYDEKWPGNPIAIRIRKAQGLDYSPIIFFDVRGDARQYVLHINPVQLTSSDYYTIPIVTDVNTKHHNDLAKGDRNSNGDGNENGNGNGNKDDIICGTITIKYLNNYIEHSIPFSYNRKYLMNRFVEEIIAEELDPEEPDSVHTAKAAVIYSTVRKAGRNAASDVESTAIKAVAILAEELQINSINTDSEEKGINDFQLLKAAYCISKDQELLADIIFPGLREYIDSLLYYAESLEAKLAEKDYIIEGLTQEAAVLAEKLAGLENENAELKSEIDRLNAELQNKAAIPATPESAGSNPDPESGDSNPSAGEGEQGEQPAAAPAGESEDGESVIEETPEVPGETLEQEELPTFEGNPDEEQTENSGNVTTPQEDLSDKEAENQGDTADDSDLEGNNPVDDPIENPIEEMDAEL